MAVINVPGGGGGFFGSLLKGLGLVAPFVPGLQPFAPFIGAAGSLASGNAAGAVQGAVAGAMNNMMPQGTPTPQNIAQNPAAATPPAPALAPDYTDRDMMKKQLAANPYVNNRYNELVNIYGNSPETDFTARQQMLRGVPDSRLARFDSMANNIALDPSILNDAWEKMRRQYMTPWSF